MEFKLPTWFTDWNKNKIIKVYGCSWCYLEIEYLPCPNDSLVSMDFMMVVNNYYTPKIYDLTNYVLQFHKINFQIN
jgi:hypothetical protein